MTENPRLKAAVHRAVGFENDGSFFEAERLYRQLVSRENAPPEAHYQFAQFLLRKGEYLEAWPHFLRRIEAAEYRERSAAQLTQPYLQKVDAATLADKTVLVYCDQGIGDAVMCARFIPVLANIADHVVFMVFEGFGDLFSSLALSNDIDVIEFGTPLPHFDVHADLFSVPALIGVTSETLPDACWMTPDTEWRVHWGRQLRHDGLKIGLAWQGNAAQARDEERSAAFADLTALFDCDHTFVCLQAGEALEQVDAVRAPDNFVIYDEISNGINGTTGRLVDCAALIAELDLVISVDSVMTHLAGAVGTPAWLLAPKVPYWVWMEEGLYSPWYPKTRIFRASERYSWRTEVASMVDMLKNPTDSLA